MEVQVHEFVDPTNTKAAARTPMITKRLALEVTEVPQRANRLTWRPAMKVTACVGPLSDLFRTAKFDPLSEFPPQEAGATDGEFEEFIGEVVAMSDAEFGADERCRVSGPRRGWGV